MDCGRDANSQKLVQPCQASELAKEATKVQEELVCELESQPGADPKLEESKDPQSTFTKEVNDIAAIARRILTKKPNIVQQMMEHLRTHPAKPFQIATKPFENQP